MQRVALGSRASLSLQDTKEQQKCVTLFLLVCGDDTCTSAIGRDSGLRYQPWAYLSDQRIQGRKTVCYGQEQERVKQMTVTNTESHSVPAVLDGLCLVH